MRKKRKGKKGGRRGRMVLMAASVLIMGVMAGVLVFVNASAEGRDEGTPAAAAQAEWPKDDTQPVGEEGVRSTEPVGSQFQTSVYVPTVSLDNINSTATKPAASLGIPDKKRTGGMIIRESELLKDVSSLDAEPPGQISDMVYDWIGTTPGSSPEGI